MKLRHDQMLALDREMQKLYHTPLFGTSFYIGEYVAWLSGGWSDPYQAQLYKIDGSKALIRTEDRRYLWVPLKHLYKEKKIK